MSRFFWIVAIWVGIFAVAAPAKPPQVASPSAAATAEPKFIDDDTFYEKFFDQIETLAKDKKTLAHNELLAKLKPGRVDITPAKPGDKVLSAEEVYRSAVKSIFVVGSLYPKKDGSWEVGTYASAWVLAADGVLVTNWHVFEKQKPDEVFGAADHEGKVYPVIDFLGGNKVADVAIFRISAKGLTPLPIATGFAEVGSWVGVISHPGDLFYLYTQGTVTRYSTNKNDDGDREKWMGVTAEYASGSSGAPVLNKYGAVVGMAAMTLSLDAIDEQEKPEKAEKPARRIKGPAKPLSRAEQPKDEKQNDKMKPPEKPKPKGSPQQMVVKMAVPSPVLLQWVGK